jgi:hypothetical protein
MSCLLEVCVVTMKVLSGGTYAEQVPTISIDSANIKHNISHFYQVENHQFDFDGYFILDTNTRIDFGFDNGLTSQKRIRSKALNIGLTQLFFINNDSYIKFGASSKWGGRTTEVACTDDSGMDKQFFCDNLSTLQPFEQLKHIKNTNLSINYSHQLDWFL